MTLKDALLLEDVEKYYRVFDKEGVTACPVHCGYYYTKPEYCDHSVYRDIGGTRCYDCWNREIPGTDELVYRPSKSEPIAKVVDVKEENGGLTVTTEPIRSDNIPSYPLNSKEKETLAKLRENPQILDSGDRTQFESGAVRDMREGKGRCDLMPLEVACRVFSDPFLDPKGFDMNLSDISQFLESGLTCYLYYVLRRFGRTHFGNYETMLLEVAKHFEEGAKKYGENNWQKGIPVHCYIDSAVRHYLKWLRGDKDEPHDRAFVWNLMCCIWEVDYHKENK